MERTASLFINDRPGNEVAISRQPDGSLVIRPLNHLASLVASLDPLPAGRSPGDIPEMEIGDVAL